jgi:hypothetical protein
VREVHRESGLRAIGVTARKQPRMILHNPWIA